MDDMAEDWKAIQPVLRQIMMYLLAYVRADWPKTAITDGSWTPPAARRAN